MSEIRRKLTFFDDFWVDFRPGTTRRWYQPQLKARLPVSGSYSSLVFDPERKKYRMYYEVLPCIGNDGPRLLKMIESEDLENWTQVLADDGSDVIFEGNGGLHGSSVMYDKLEKNPAWRYKLVGMTEIGDTPFHTWFVNLAFSADGVHWENHREMVASPRTSDALNKLYYNPISKEYNMLHRFDRRRVSVRSSPDMIHWSEPRFVLHPSGVFNDGFTAMEHYSMTGGWFDGIFYGLLWRYNTRLHDMDYTKMFGYMEPELVYSYDGKEFLYTSGKPLVERPMAPTPGWAGLNAMDMCDSLDGQSYYLLMSGSMFVHGTPESNQILHDRLVARGIMQQKGQLLYEIRKDGFCGIEAVGKGTVTTKPLKILKDDLSINVRAECGMVRVGLMDWQGNWLEGFSVDDCIPFEFDESVDLIPQWKEHKLSELIGQGVRIVIELNGAVLHALSLTTIL